MLGNMNKNKIIIIDYGMGNILSVQRAFEKYCSNVFLSSDVDEILSADKLVLPGVGAFGKAMEELDKRNLIRAIQTFVKLNKPLLGICLGMQLLFDEGYEFGKFKGLGIISGSVISIVNSKNKHKKLKVPHIGWSNLHITKNENESMLNFKNLINKNDYFYFVHSYMGVPQNEKHLLAYSYYVNEKIPAIIGKNMVLGCQFHPEKSGKTGLKLIRNFCEY